MIITDLNNCLVKKNTTIKSCILNLEKSTKQIIFVINKDKKLLGSITDGDLRRAMLNNFNINDKITNIYNKNPIKTLKSTSEHEAQNIMRLNQINHLPVVDTKNKIYGFYLFYNIKNEKNKLNCDFVIMAGGKGKRLRPYTDNCPKPMLKLSGKPILETILEKAKKQGFSNFFISINYLGGVIQKYFKNGKNFGLKISYIKEKTPLGTLGALGSCKKEIKKKYVIVTNGDVITEINYQSMIEFHEQNKSDATMAVYPYKTENPYGVVKTKDTNIINIDEKPVSISYINAGVYIFNESIINYIKKDQAMDAVTFFNLLRKKNKRTIAFAIHESWVDIGVKKDYLNYSK
ncbi:nucleotidyltransferase family protein [Candidatus Pelagibacter sp.]|nr:nucleotidyltransferase family protein [Candidatus Pelagibacter sp.]